MIRTLAVIISLAMMGTPIDVTAGFAGRQADERGLVKRSAEVREWPGSSKRWALVIGVDQYRDRQISPLSGAANDARLLANTLVQYAGFPADQVILLATDQPDERQPTRVNILRRLSNLTAVLPNDGLLVFAFAGHGIERRGQAFLLPSDAQISDDVSFLQDTSLSVSRLREGIKATGVQQVVMMLDACRNDPTGRADAPNLLSEAYTRGLYFDVRNREVVAFATLYATAVGERAFEYTEKRQGYFTWAVVEAMKGAAANQKGEITLSSLVRYIQDAVPKRIGIDLGRGKDQRPFAIIEGYKADDLVLAVAQPGLSPASLPGADAVSVELRFWDSIKDSQNPDDFKAYLERYPNGSFASLANNRVKEFEASRPEPARSSASVELLYWDSVKNSDNPEDFNEYLRRYPGGEFTALARRRLDAIAAAEERERPTRAAAERAKNTFEVRHFHRGFSKFFFPAATIEVLPEGVSYREFGQHADSKHTFLIPCKDLSNANGPSLAVPSHWAPELDRLGYRDPGVVRIKGAKEQGHDYIAVERAVGELLVRAIEARCGKR